MRQRLLQLIGVATTVVVVSLAMATIAGQAPAQKGPAAKTSWGEPNLQGIWKVQGQSVFHGRGSRRIGQGAGGQAPIR